MFTKATMQIPYAALFPGLMSALTVALAARFISEQYGAPVMLIALLMGMAFGFLGEKGTRTIDGITFASGPLLKFGVALMGLGITFQQILSLGPVVLFITLAGVGLTIALGPLLARMWGRRTRFGLLIGGAVAICGASAALAISSVLPKSKTLERDTVFAVIAVTVLSTVAMVLYPVLAGWLGLSDVAAGVFLGATIHDVAQVVGAGYTVSQEAGETATIVKLLRVALLLPLVIALSYVFATNDVQARHFPIPVFVIGFAVLVAAGSLSLVPEALQQSLLSLSRWCLVVAISALGMKTSLGRLADVGGSAIALVCSLTAILAGLVLGLVFFLIQ